MGIFSDIGDLFNPSDEDVSKRREDMEKIREKVKNEHKEGTDKNPVEEADRDSDNRESDARMPWKNQPPSEESLTKPRAGVEREDDGGEKHGKGEAEDRYEKETEERSQRYEKGELESSSGVSESPLEGSEMQESPGMAGMDESTVASDLLAEEDPSDIDVPDAPEVKEVETPEIEKGSLFIRVEKFRKAERTLADMRRVVGEIESDVGGLENGLDDDRRVRKELEEVIGKLEASLGSAKDIVSP